MNIACRSPLNAYQHVFMKTKKGKSLIVFGDKRRVKIDSNIRNWKTIEIPCGQCIDCRIRRRKEWSIRLMYEYPKHNYGYFLTITYDDDHIPENGSLKVEDMQTFIKNWRDKRKIYHRENLKMYYCGEYGDEGQRPHYHMIRFLDNPIPDLKYHKLSNGLPLYKSDILSKKWGKGYIYIGNVTQESCEYVAGYINKKILGKGATIYDEKGVIPPFTISSNGISILSKEELEKIYNYDVVNLAGRLGNLKKFKPPKNFDKQLEELDEEWYELIKAKRREIAIIDRERKLMKTTQPEDEYLKTEAMNKDARRFLKRSDQ